MEEKYINTLQMRGLYVARSKYGARKTIVDGIKFDSKGEANRYKELKFLVDRKEVKDLELQPKFDFIVNNKKICSYRADFKYYDKALRKTVVEDFKGFRTAIYKIKRKLFEALYPEYHFLETSSK